MHAIATLQVGGRLGRASRWLLALWQSIPPSELRGTRQGWEESFTAVQATPKLPLAGSRCSNSIPPIAVPMQLPCRTFHRLRCPYNVKRNPEEWPVAYVAWGDSRSIRVGRLLNLALIPGRLEGHMATEASKAVTL